MLEGGLKWPEKDQDLKFEKQSTSPEPVGERIFQTEGKASANCEKQNSRQKAMCLEQGGVGRGAWEWREGGWQGGSQVTDL